MNPPTSALSLNTCRQRIALIWWVGGGLLIVAIVSLLEGAQLFEAPGQAVGWLLPHVAPTMMLTGAVPIFGKARPQAVDEDGLRFLFRLAAGPSTIYLFIIALVIVIAVHRAASGGAPMAVQLAGWNVVLGVLQGLPASLIGIFFAQH